ncbi:hypothetical protein [Inquilinus sp.]|uniref:hypothetical protein n=1 Tax=Inquilinus sp. TaxID=1932117 RepID=UPI0031D3CD68
MANDLATEALRATELLAGKTVKLVRRHREGEILIEFTDQTRLFVDSKTALEISLTGTDELE